MSFFCKNRLLCLECRVVWILIYPVSESLTTQFATMLGDPKMLRGLPAPKLNNCTREQLKSYFANAWKLYEWLFLSMRTQESAYMSPDPLRNPLIFYFGHTSAFYINKLKLAGLISDGIDPVLDRIFAVGVDPADPSEISDQPQYPDIREAVNYRWKAFELVLDFIEKHNFPAEIGSQDPEWALLMGFAHDRIHFETSSVLIRQVPLQHVRKPAGWEYAPQNAPTLPLNWVEIPGQSVVLGRTEPGEYFGWDNEFGRREVKVAPFAVTNRHVTNREFMEFWQSGGYEQKAFWTENGWHWRESHGINHPRFWVPKAGGMAYRAMFEELPMPMEWPVELTCYEAMAYCAWKGEGCRLLSEAEWRILANDAIAQHNPDLADGHYNLHLRYGSPWAASTAPEQGTLGLRDVLGNVWTWLSDDWNPLEGFSPHPYYQDFSSPYFDKDHGMMLGGSWASTGLSASPNYRLWFRREFMQHAGFRLAKSI